MTKALNICIYNGILFILAITLLLSCKSETVCPDEEHTTNAAIVSISSPLHLKVGEQTTLTVAVRNNPSFCTMEANASFVNIGLDTLLINAELNYRDKGINAGCNCKTDSIIYTLLYFTPLNKGTYYFIAEKDSTSSVGTGDKVDCIITVE